jgi:PadR family transcriptional regulator PadR
MTRTALGDLEHQVLLATLRLKDQAYSVSVVLEIEERTGREVAQAAVFIALRRLEDKGLLRSRREEEADETGRARRYFTLTAAGMEKLREMRRALKSLWQGFGAELDGAS